MNIIFRKFNSFLKLIKGRRWGVIWTKIPLLKKSLSITNYFPHPQNYRYILIGGHGLGMTALIYYLDKIKAKPTEIWTHEVIRPFVFYRDFDGLVLDKAPLNPDAKNVLKTLKKKVPLYQMVRDPISIIKSNVNVTMFHSISQINSKTDATHLLRSLIENISHLMFCFASTRSLINHIATDVSYIRMDDINEKNLPSTLQDFAKRFGYEANGGGAVQNNDNNESVIKGSLFPRCFPHTFSINAGDEKYDFILCTHSRLQAHSRKEIDMNTRIQAYQKIPKSYAILKDNIVPENYPQYPLLLVSPISKVPPKDLIDKADDHIKEYLIYVFEQISKHQKYAFTEDDIIDYLCSNKDFALKLANKIHQELSFIRKEKPELLDEFIHTQRFLQQCGIDVFSNPIKKDTDESR
ncbi:DUF2972 domain-containing protein [Helicobacter sp. 11S02596-1]|uniref:DUF2972 domain-containing protein n=1 Tax=Helicobacter sp. 11S02596-1 TaxID=1476194 RepID=UPI000BA5DF35|nr:DUF2972 domain-containing protein [Helicobacter sp. 11S02596-1]PAF45184.1 hypothetical protein BJI48_01055 [Helicobacter sp. 11S02596-1]